MLSGSELMHSILVRIVFMTRYLLVRVCCRLPKNDTSPLSAPLPRSSAADRDERLCDAGLVRRKAAERRRSAGNVQPSCKALRRFLPQGAKV